MDLLNIAMLVAVAVGAAVVLTGVVILAGTLAVRLLRLPTDPPEAIAFEPPAPEVVRAGDPEAARARAAAGRLACERGLAARKAIAIAREALDLGEWIAENDRVRGQAAKAAATEASAGAEAAAAAFRAGDDAGVQKAVLAVTTAGERVRVLAEGLPDWRVAQRRRLLLMTGALAAVVAIGAVAAWLR